MKPCLWPEPLGQIKWFDNAQQYRDKTPEHVANSGLGWPPRRHSVFKLWPFSATLTTQNHSLSWKIVGGMNRRICLMDELVVGKDKKKRDARWKGQKRECEVPA